MHGGMGNLGERTAISRPAVFSRTDARADPAERAGEPPSGRVKTSPSADRAPGRMPSLPVRAARHVGAQVGQRSTGGRHEMRRRLGMVAVLMTVAMLAGGM